MKKVLITAHDAGGAEVISAWVKANPQYQYYFILQGPAIRIFFRKICKLQNYSIDKFSQVIAEVDFVLTGTSWGTDLEKIIISLAKLHGIFVISYLDHWTNYLERFLYQGGYCFPDEIWVGDCDAEIIAKEIFKETPIQLVPNQYFVEMRKEYEKIVTSSNKERKLINLLYVCEPISSISLWREGYGNGYGYTEFSGLQFFFDCIRNFQIKQYLNEIKVRLHPSENKDKYDVFIEYAQKNNLPVLVSHEMTLLEDLAWADGVVGISSMALVIADQFNKMVFTCIPQGAIVTKLPMQSIKSFDHSSISKLFHSS